MFEECPQCRNDKITAYIEKKEKKDKKGSYYVNPDGSFHTIPQKQTDGTTKWLHVFNQAEADTIKNGGILGAGRTPMVIPEQPIKTPDSKLVKIEDLKLTDKERKITDDFERFESIGFLKAVEITKKLQPDLTERDKDIVIGMVRNHWATVGVQMMKNGNN